MKKQKLRIALAQINSTVGDLDSNCSKIIHFLEMAKEKGVDIVCFPELAVSGYPPEDLLLKPKFIDDNLEALDKLASSVRDIIAIVGFVQRKNADIYNAAAVIYNGKIKGVYRKMYLPNYGVFDEQRYFKTGDKPEIYKFGACVFGVNICEDIWHTHGPVKKQAQLGARLILNINASPYYAGRIKDRERVIRSQARDNKVCIAYVNLVGGQDELVFDGQSMVVDAGGKIIVRAGAFEEELLTLDVAVPASARAAKKKNQVVISDTYLPKEKIPLQKNVSAPLKPEAEIYLALCLGLGDYVSKNGFQKVVIGLSGGIDSALVATIAVDALGKDNVTGVFMPSRYSSRESENDALQLSANLGIKLMNISIDAIYKVYLLVLEEHFCGFDKNIAEENLQARIRGNILMALSNKFGWLVLTTGNKSEMSTGYATLYGDMAGGFALIKDVPKVLVYKLARYRNSKANVIPENIFVKAPTAELKPNQKDSDILPVYDILDPILKAYVEEDKALEQIVSLGFDREIVSKVIGMVDKSEYKRRQSPPGIKITPKAFGRDRRMPITNKYSECS